MNERLREREPGMGRSRRWSLAKGACRRSATACPIAKHPRVELTTSHEEKKATKLAAATPTAWFSVRGAFLLGGMAAAGAPTGVAADARHGFPAFRPADRRVG